MGRDTRKPIFGGLQITKAQTSLCILADCLAPLLFAFWKVSYLNFLQAKFKAAEPVTFDLLILELMFLFFKNSKKKKFRYTFYQFRKS